MSYTEFVKPYPNGYENGESGNTPVTAAILNTNYDGFLLALNEFLPELKVVEANPSESATAGNLTKLKVGNSIYLIPSGGSGGSTVEWEQIQLTGTKIATITIDNVPVDVYAPSGGGSGDEVSWNQVLGSGTKIGTITINGTPTDVYAPTPIDVEANPSGSASAGDLTKLKVGNYIYSIPSGGSGGASDLSDLGDVTITNLQNGQILKWNATTSKWENSNESGGGGTGGHTIIDENGNSMSARAGLQFVGGANVSDDATNNKTIVDLASAGGIDGVFIDTNNVVKDDFISDGTAHTWIATEDCILAGMLVANLQNSGAYISIDGIYTFVTYEYTNGNGAFISVKKGQTIEYRAKSGSSFEAYGIQTGTTHSKFQPVIYSTEPQEIGVWTDGKPLYVKTYITNNATIGTEVNIDISSLGIDTPVSCNGYFSRKRTGASFDFKYPFNAYESNSTNSFIRFDESNITYKINLSGDYTDYQRITIQYTKTSDVAGSGTWTPQGVPTHHYSTDEQIVGTWMGETLWEKTIQTTFTATVKINNAFYLGDTPIVGLSNTVDKYMITNFMTNTIHKIFSVIYDKGNDCFTISNLDNVTTATPINITLQYTKSS